MKKVLYLPLLLGLFIITTAETCEDCDQVVIEQLEECSIEVASLQTDNTMLNTNLDYSAQYAQNILAGKLCPPPCRGPNPCDMCQGCNLANCQFFVNADDAPNTTIEIYDEFQNLVATSGQANQLNDNFSFLNIDFFGNIPEQGVGFIQISGPNGVESYPFDFDTN